MKEAKPTGCEACPRNKVPGINKIMGQVLGKRIMIWPQSPGMEENRAKRELVGRSGQWLWKELGRIGVQREDCDIQNVMRCAPMDRGETGYWESRDPSKEELKCCNVYNKLAIEKQRAKVWLVFGRVARDQLFTKSKLPGNVFFQGSTRVFILDHPAYFLRGAPQARLDQFRETLDLVKETLSGKSVGKFDVYRDLKVQIITTEETAVEAAKTILRGSSNGNRVAYDEEDDVIDGEKKLLLVAAVSKPGMAHVFVLDHPENTASDKDKNTIRQVLRKLIEHKHEKVLQHGNHDDGTFEKLLGAKMKNFFFDTQYADFFADTVRAPGTSYALSAIVARNFPRYTGYKDLVQAAVPKGLSVEDGRDIGEFHLAKAPLRHVAIYCGMDANLTKMEELRVKDRIPIPLLRVYTESAYTLDRMEKFGPLFDYQHYSGLSQMYPNKKEFHRKQLCLMADNSELNPNSPKQLNKLIYEQWGLEPVTRKANTQKETLELLQHVYHSHKGIKSLQEYREAKNRLERIEAFKRSADAHAGRVTTVWWVTGARTGRMSSGGGTRPDKRNLGNLQNTPRDPFIENLLVSSTEWRKFYTVAMKSGLKEAFRQYSSMDWFLVADYSQMELRVLALVAQEAEMLDMFNSGKDIHAAIGSLWSGWSEAELLEEGPKRTMVKVFHFSVIYGKTPPGLHMELQAKGVKISLRQVETHINNYFKRFKQVAAYIKAMPEFALNHGYVENLFGFRVPIDAQQGNERQGGFWRNQAVNSPIQGAAHQVLLCALALVKRDPEKYQLIRTQMEIHDALVNVTPLKEILNSANVLRQLLEQDVLTMIREELKVNWSVPLKADMKIGLRMGGLTKFKGDLRASIQSVDKEGKPFGVLDKIRYQERELLKLQQQFAAA